MKPIKVLTVGHSYVVTLNRAVMAKVANDPAIDLTVVAPRFFHGDLRKITLEIPEAPAYRLVALPAYGTRSTHMFVYGGLMPVVRSGSFDLLHCWEEPFSFAGYQTARAAHVYGVRYFFWTAQNLPKRYPPPFSNFERYSLKHACGWLAGGHTVQQALLARGYPHTLAEIVTHHVDEERFRPDPAEGAEVRRRLGLKGPVVGYSGRLTKEKGMNLLMAALERVPGDWSLLALGGGPYEAKLKHWAESRGWSDRLRVVLATTRCRATSTRWTL
jgi:glycosyltransferase involved in cell wall biosynthesis